jgi:hypothetical protein
MESALNQMYILVLFPDVQEYMEKEWFDSEAVQCTVNDKNHSLAKEYSAYFIPVKYLNNKIKFHYEK